MEADAEPVLLRDQPAPLLLGVWLVLLMPPPVLPLALAPLMSDAVLMMAAAVGPEPVLREPVGSAAAVDEPAKRPELLSLTALVTAVDDPAIPVLLAAAAVLVPPDDATGVIA